VFEREMPRPSKTRTATVLPCSWEKRREEIKNRQMKMFLVQGMTDKRKNE
jgi:hypothetical protein